ncbi:chorismate mutase aro7, variant 2 [Entomophthora muscae]|uniref:Chorismate mutase aro7, variant 2 n=1 Tax=Entomophthora muscae TaxID=34485 RepID=A0ACC2RH81_9FUNG|nr:chorismate mutase aro7, variant 2 [Entomophthora muscae]
MIIRDFTSYLPRKNFKHLVFCLTKCSPDEYPFTDDLPKPVLPPLEWPIFLKSNSINLNKKIFQTYITEIAPKICSEGDDMNHGTAATLDIEVLQALSRRIHYGKFIAEAKYQDPKNRDKYIELIKNKDREAIMALLTDSAVEEQLLKRLRRKAEIYGQDVVDGETDQRPSNYKIGVDLVANTYRDFVIPLTKEVEVLYLLARLD